MTWLEGRQWGEQILSADCATGKCWKAFWRLLARVWLHTFTHGFLIQNSIAGPETCVRMTWNSLGSQGDSWLCSQYAFLCSQPPESARHGMFDLPCVLPLLSPWQCRADRYCLPQWFKARTLCWWICTCVCKLLIVWDRIGYVQRKRCSEIPAQKRKFMTRLAVLISWGLCARPGSAHMPNFDWIWLMLHVLTMLVLACRMQGSFSLRRCLSIPVISSQQAVTSGHVSLVSVCKRQTRNSSTPLCKIVSCSGPKAGGGRARATSPGKGLQRLFAITVIMCAARPTTGVRVVGVTMASTGVTESALLNSHTIAVAKQHGSPNMGSSFSSIRKRSFKRACRRAARQGGAWYRGQWLTDGELPRPVDAPAPKRKQHTIKCVQQGGRRLYVMCWNVGGLSTGLFDELLAWLALPQQKYISAVLLQETHWQHQSEWCSGNWTCVHSGDSSHKYAGVMCMLSNNCFQPRHVRHQTLIDGRLLHVRAGALHDAVDFLCLYQHPWNVRVPKQELHVRRDKVWKQLDRAISAQPKRNLLVIGGDFNVQLGPHGRAVGTAVQHRHAHDQIAEDPGRLMDIITMRDLCAVNTWRGPKSSMITYQMGTHGAQIDFLLTRTGRADALAKTSRPMRDFPVADWRLGGQHIPLLASFRTNLKRWMHKPTHNTPKRADLCNLRSDDPLGS